MSQAKFGQLIGFVENENVYDTKTVRALGTYKKVDTVLVQGIMMFWLDDTITNQSYPIYEQIEKAHNELTAVAEADSKQRVII